MRSRLLATIVFLASLFAVPALAQSCGTITTCPVATTPLNGTEVTLGVQSARTVQIPVQAIGNLAPAATWTGPLPNEVPRTIQGKLEENVSVLDFGALCDGSTDDTTAINAAVAAENAAGGGSVWLPATGHLCKTSATINMLPGVTLRGYGDGTFVLPGSGILYSGTGDAIASIQAINSDTNVSNGVRDIQVVCTNGSNVGAGYDDVGGTFVTLDHLRVLACGYDVVFDQTEVATIADSDLETALIANLWLVNDAEHTAGADANFTNNITVRGTEFNTGSTTNPLVIDDGGVAHVFDRNNFNGGGVSFANAGTAGLVLQGNEFESATSTNLTFKNTTAQAGTGVGSSSGISIRGNQITPTAGNHAVALVSVGSVEMTANSIGNNAASRIAVTSAFSLTLNSNFINGGYSNELTGTPANLYNLDGGAAAISFTSLTLGAKLMASSTGPTIASGFGTTPALFFAGNTAAFEIEVGTGGTATFGVLTMPAAANAWSCAASDKTTQSSTVFLTKQVGTASSTAVTLENFNTSGAAAAWAASDFLIVSCTAF